MPFKSQSQEKFMYSQHPDIAAKWQKEYGQPKELPMHIEVKQKHPTDPSHVKNATGMSTKSPWLSMNPSKEIL